VRVAELPGQIARGTQATLITMLLGGLWHGAGWTFLAWGALHGVYLIINHGWRALGVRAFAGSAAVRLVSWTLTFLAVVVAWVFFRAPDLGTAFDVLAGMAGLHGMAVRVLIGTRELIVLAVLMAMALCCPNLREIMAQEELILAAMHRRAEPAAPFPTLAIRWRPTAVWATASVGLFVVSLLQMTHISQFLYFQF